MRLSSARAVRTNPQFQILGPIVSSVPVLVMHRLIRQKFSVKHFLHDEPVLKNVLGPAPSNDVATVIDVTRSAFTDLEVQRITVSLEPLVMRGAVAPPGDNTIASVNLAGGSGSLIGALAYRGVKCATMSETLVVHWAVPLASVTRRAAASRGKAPFRRLRLTWPAFLDRDIKRSSSKEPLVVAGAVALGDCRLVAHW